MPLRCRLGAARQGARRDRRVQLLALLLARMGGEVDIMGVNIRLFEPSQLSGLKLSFPDGRGWSGEGAWGYAREHEVMR